MGLKTGVRYVVIAVFLAAITCISCRNDEEEISQMYVKRSGPSEVSDHLLLYVSRGGKLSYEFSAPLYCVYHEPQSYQETPKGLKIINYTSDGTPNAVLTAKYGVHYENKRMMEAKNTVVIRNLQTGEKIETEHLIWDMDAHKVYSHTTTKQTCPDGSVYIGDSFESDENFEHYTITQPKLLIYEE